MTQLSQKFAKHGWNCSKNAAMIWTRFTGLSKNVKSNIQSVLLPSIR